MSSKIPQEVIKAAQASMKKWNIPASVIIAQWALESAWGKSTTGKFNYGGITALVKDAVFPYKPGTPLEPATLCTTHEQYKGKLVECKRWFKDYTGPDDYFDAHGKLLATSKYYVNARKVLPDPIKFSHTLTGVYATALNYGTLLESIIKGSENLIQYDKGI